MISFPDFSSYGYQAIEVLGQNSEGGRVAYRALDSSGKQVVIKQFQFAKGADWDGFKAIEREIEVLQGLEHKGIPAYIDSFETDNGFCLVMQDVKAKVLTSTRSFDAVQVKQIVIKLLEILVYLQQRVPPVIHRDLKPENILVDDALNVYLIDFGVAKVGSGTVAISSVNGGTYGFMAPEQIRNLQLTKASDLYSLGMTLICFLGNIPSGNIGEYVDSRNQLDRKRIIKKLNGYSLRFIDWLNKLVEPDPQDRFPDAAKALEAFKPLYVVRVPEVKFFKEGEEFDPSKIPIEFKATKLGEKVTQTIRLVNPIPETDLEGHWEIAPHQNDLPYTSDNHQWISLSTKKFKGNSVPFRIMVDTSKLIAQANGRRDLILHLNTNEEIHTVPIQIETAPLPLPSQRFTKSYIVKSIIIFFVSMTLPCVVIVFLTFLGDALVIL